MELTPEQQNAIARLYENESLTENLTDQDAQALLEWAQGQITANTDDTLVRAAVSAANSSGEQGVQALVTQASTFLAQELAVRESAAARENESPGSMTMGDALASPTESTADELTRRATSESSSPMTMGDALASPTESTANEWTGRATSDNPAGPQASAYAAEANTFSAVASVRVGNDTTTPTPPPAPKRKKSRKSKRKKKK